MIPVITAGLHFNCIAATLHHNNCSDALCIFYRFIGLWLQRKHFTAAIATICSNQNFCFSVINAICKCLRGEAAEYNRVSGADSRTCQHGNCGLWNHRKIDIDSVTFGDSKSFQYICELLYFIKQLRIRHRARITRFTFKMKRDLVAFSSKYVTVEAVVRHVCLSTHKPFTKRQIPFADGVPRPRPFNKLRCLSRPESLVITIGLFIQMSSGHQCVLLECIRRWKLSLFPLQCINCVVVI